MNSALFSTNPVARENDDVPIEQETNDEWGQEPSSNRQYLDWYKCSAVERMPGQSGGAVTLRGSR
jgi:hypothetical protein